MSSSDTLPSRADIFCTHLEAAVAIAESNPEAEFINLGNRLIALTGMGAMAVREAEKYGLSDDCDLARIESDLSRYAADKQGAIYDGLRGMRLAYLGIMRGLPPQIDESTYYGLQVLAEAGELPVNEVVDRAGFLLTDEDKETTGEAKTSNPDGVALLHVRPAFDNLIRIRFDRVEISGKGQAAMAAYERRMIKILEDAKQKPEE